MDPALIHSPPPTPPPSGRFPSTDWAQKPALTVRRPLGSNELAYYLPSRAEGVNDMYLHHHLVVGQAGLVDEPGRIATAWAIVRGRHPLLAARVELSSSGSGEGSQANVWEFVYDAPSSAADAVARAKQTLTFEAEQMGPTGEDRLRTFLNGPRTLSASKFAHLVVSHAPSTVAQPPPAARDLSERPTTSRTSDKDGEAWDVILFVGHFAADGLALHALADAFFALAFGPASVDEAEAVDGGTVRSVMQLERLLQRETLARLEARSTPFPPSADERLTRLVLGPLDYQTGHSAARSTSSATTANGSPPFDPRRAWRRAVARVLYQRATERSVGGQILDRSVVQPAGEPLTHVSSVLLSPADSARALAACKRRGVNVGQAVIGALNAGWAVTRGDALDAKEPSLFYSAMSIRPYLADASILDEFVGGGAYVEPTSFAHLALGYYTLSLPSFLLSPSTSSGPGSPAPTRTTADLSPTVWHRARHVKHQTARITAKGWPTAARVWAEGEARGERARDWARKDDEAEAVSAASKTGSAALVGLGLGVDMVQSTVEQPPTENDDDAVGKPINMAGTSPQNTPPLTAPTTPAAPVFASSTKPAPAKSSASTSNRSAPLLGLSLLGNLDGVYQPAQAYPVVRLERLTTGSRQRIGAALLFVYSFAGRLGLSLGWETGALGGDESELGRWWSATRTILGHALLGQNDGLMYEEHVV